MAQHPSQEKEALTASLASNSNPLTGARAFTAPTHQLFSEGASSAALETSLMDSWAALIDVASNTAHESQTPLVKIIQAVQQQRLSKNADPDAAKVSIWGEEVTVWKDMPLLGPAIRDVWNRTPGTGSNDEFSPSQWLNMNAFLARLTALSPSIPEFDYSLYAIWTMRDAFEGSSKRSRVNVEAARMWFLYASEVIERWSQEGKSFEGKVAMRGEGFKGKEWWGFSLERLGVWKAAME